MRQKQIAIGFFGITRSLKWTAPSIKKNIIDPIRPLGNIMVYGHFYKIKFIKNKRSGENQPVHQNDDKNLKFDELLLENPDHILKKIDYKKILSYGDAWDDDGKSLSNLIHQLASLKRLAGLISKQKPDVVILARPDLYYRDSFLDVVKLHLKLPSYYVSVPHWQWFGGVNDRFAVLGYEAFLAYASRLDAVHKYLETEKKPLHSESFLWKTLIRNNIIISTMDIKAHRVRANGIELSEGFEKLTLSRIIRYNLANFMSRLKRMVSKKN
jgi:hypothetical protein